MYDPPSDRWREWKLHGAAPQAYSVYVDERDIVWLTDFGANAMISFDPATETFETYGHYDSLLAHKSPEPAALHSCAAPSYDLSPWQAGSTTVHGGR